MVNSTNSTAREGKKIPEQRLIKIYGKEQTSKNGLNIAKLSRILNEDPSSGLARSVKKNTLSGWDH